MLDTLCYAECSLLACNAGLANAAVFVHLSSHIEVCQPVLHIGEHAEWLPLKMGIQWSCHVSAKTDADNYQVGMLYVVMQCSCVGGHVLTVFALHTAKLTQAPVLCRA